ncbi:DUF4124 domain-containing protein [Shewanella sp. Isolate8]|uniref:DUF4124 domain-containing protein n=1 Tax=Shewanella sp. Isolate8 TaxID=2908529 RepID=UPI001EFC3336|nr:DUF4124 domain-containing protein [Shewanella sp. Isolate8]MCG9745272.1 DUF4124 domain-containing protein [Shewanella sp. Isolate8]
MGKLLLAIALLLLPGLSHASSIYKCIKGDKVVFSQTSCPKEFKQHHIQYQLGITTEIDSDKPKEKLDPLQALLNKRTLSQEKLLQLIDAEVYRLKQENSYYEILRASEKQKLDRKRYWQKQAKDDPEFLTKVDEMNSYFDGLIKLNKDAMFMLKQHKRRITAPEQEEQREQVDRGAPQVVQH